VIHGGGGNDIIAALQAVQALCGGSGNDVVVGAALVAVANGDGGNDVVSTATIAQIARGGSGNDTVLTFGGFAGATSGDAGTDVCVNINGTGFPGFPLGDPLNLFGGFVPGDSLNGTCESGVDL
jgi:Ca2+-binding RTX toxin-like protein